MEKTTDKEGVCPHCNSGDINYLDFIDTGSEAIELYNCIYCEKEFEQVYVLTYKHTVYKEEE